MQTIRITITTPTPVNVEIAERIQKLPSMKEQLAELFRKLGVTEQEPQPEQERR